MDKTKGIPLNNIDKYCAGGKSHPLFVLPQLYTEEKSLLYFLHSVPLYPIHQLSRSELSRPPLLSISFTLGISLSLKSHNRVSTCSLSGCSFWGFIEQ